ncbi:SDR family NAD(P)-dependent oxidoreductase [Pseudooceanicola algae]|uniref:3-oxoacyl-[acyl-carrier-protein] reductase FabG n=1 Tax=Pseudooceanicola algae TaxID=1537215 RepID=A0A418SFN0_9RHOB|nr:SDR family NAD(P)-dependent oxidoreductase [Pseudooceanicola algae]QPM91504.1 3-oxoacyl-[acyl-carrier-protein] reductase FabG [Pseudooceanicola algae]
MTKPIAIVTGAAQGIGFTCAEVLAEQGFAPVLVDVQEKVLTSAETLGAPGYICDMADPAAVKATFARIAEDHGAPTALAHCAGIAVAGDFLTCSVEDFKRVIDLNLTGTFVANQTAANLMIAAGIQGAIVNMSSIAALLANPAISSYVASKAGVTGFTKAASLALAPHNIRVNAVGPGSIDTAMMAAVNSNPAAMDTAMSRTPLKRMGTAREVAEAVAFLAGPKSSYITGETLYIDGGRQGLNYTC